MVTLSVTSSVLGTIISEDLPGAHGAGADADAAHLPQQVADLDHVAHVDRPFKEQYQAADKVVDHALQTEADPDPERADQDRELRKT